MNATVPRERLAAGAVGAGGLAGLVLVGALPAFAGYVAGVQGLVSVVVPTGQVAPGLALALGAAFLVGLSMNLLPCNLPIVMSLLPATAGAESRGAFARRTGLYGLGALAALGSLGFVLGRGRR